MKCYLDKKELREFGDYGAPHPNAPKTNRPAIANAVAIGFALLCAPLFIGLLWALWTVAVPLLILVALCMASAFFKY